MDVPPDGRSTVNVKDAGVFREIGAVGGVTVTWAVATDIRNTPSENTINPFGFLSKQASGQKNPLRVQLWEVYQTPNQFDTVLF